MSDMIARGNQKKNTLKQIEQRVNNKTHYCGTCGKVV